MVEVGRLAHRTHRRVVNHSFKSGITIAASLLTTGDTLDRRVEMAMEL